MSNTIEKFKPCPFCGNAEPILHEIEAHTHMIATFMPDHPGSWAIECGGAGCGLGFLEETRAGAVEAWNRRVVEPEAIRNSRITATPYLGTGESPVEWSKADTDKLYEILATYPPERNTLPPMPEPFGMIDIYYLDGNVRGVEGYTAMQMRDYARLARATLPAPQVSLMPVPHDHFHGKPQESK